MEFTAGFFIALILILIGVSILIKSIFNINIPVFRILLGALFIFIGIKILVGREFYIFSNRSLNYTNNSRHSDYNNIFGKTDIDMTGYPTPEGIKKLEINTVFGGGILRISENIPIVIKANSAFSGIKFPNETVISFGQYTYKTQAAENSNSYYEVTVNVVFGGLEIRK